MANAKKILLVEGEADKGFFKQICKKLSLWLAWQTTPGHGLYHIVYDNLLDENAKEYK